MNERITSLYAAVTGNEVVCFNTNLAEFVKQMNNMEPKSRNYDWFYRQFKKDSAFDHTIGDKVYHFQRLI